MSTKSNKTSSSIQSQFLELLVPQSAEDIHEFDVIKAHFEIVSAFEQCMIKDKVTKKALAAQVGTSPAYLTQIFSGNKMINLDLMVRIQKALELEFVASFCKKDEKVVSWIIRNTEPRFRSEEFEPFQPFEHNPLEEVSTLIA
jgi:transcriptional regulator with XRE-family HTH domain